MVGAVLSGHRLAGLPAPLAAGVAGEGWGFPARTRRHFAFALAAAILLHLLSFAALIDAGPAVVGPLSQPAISLPLVTAPAPAPAPPPPAVPSTPPAAHPPPPRPAPTQPAPTPTPPEPAASVAPTTPAPPAPVAAVPASPAPSEADIPVAAEPAVAEAPPAQPVASAQRHTPPSSEVAYHRNPDPHYPRAARRRGMEGVVELAVTVDRDGLPLEIRIRQSSGFEVLDREAQRAVRQWRFEPARRGGIAVTGEVVVPIRFRLQAG